MPAGRPRKPTSLHKLHGTARRDRGIVGEPEPPPSPLDPPRELCRTERAIWREIAPVLVSLGLLTDLDRPSLARFCAAVAEWRLARRMIRKEGAVIVVNGAAQRSQWVRIRDEAGKVMDQLGARFGMTPADRPRLGRPAKGDVPPLPSASALDDGESFDAFLASKPQ